MSYIVAIDQGTTSTRSILFDHNMSAINISQKEFTQYFPHSGWVEHDPEDLWNTAVSTFRDVLKKSKLTADKITAIGITNQRETTVVWDLNLENVLLTLLFGKIEEQAISVKNLKNNLKKK